MSRVLTVGAAQLGPIPLADTRTPVVDRLIALLRSGSAAGCHLVVFPELTLTTFFPRWWVADLAEADLDLCANYKETLCDFDRYRRPEVYGRITAQRGPEVPAEVRSALDASVESGEERP